MHDLIVLAESTFRMTYIKRAGNPQDDMATIGYEVFIHTIQQWHGQKFHLWWGLKWISPWCCCLWKVVFRLPGVVEHPCPARAPAGGLRMEYEGKCNNENTNTNTNAITCTNFQQWSCDGSIEWFTYQCSIKCSKLTTKKLCPGKNAESFWKQRPNVWILFYFSISSSLMFPDAT